MNEMTDEDLDRLLTGHFRGCLDGQVGRAAAAFRHERRQAPARRVGLWLSIAGAAVAAGVAVVFGAFNTRQPAPTVAQDPQPEVTPLKQFATADEPPPMVQSTTWSGVMDDGLGLVDDRPVRRLRRKVVEEVEWYDAKSNAVVKTIQPRQQVFLIDMKTD
jgi:hypothetical protein